MTPEAQAILERLLDRMRQLLGGKLVGLYVYGSLVTGDFDPRISDLDLMAAIATELDEGEFTALDRMHHEIAREWPQWRDRIEIAYITLDALRTFKTQTRPLAIISPGEPFHHKDAGIDWLINWYLVREKGRTLYGPPPETLIAPLSHDEYIAAVRAQALDWGDWINGDFDRPYQGYAILTLCRAFYTHVHGEHASKRQAAAWAKGQMPEWVWLIDEALRWREAALTGDTDVDHAATMSITRRFVHDVIARIHE